MDVIKFIWWCLVVLPLFCTLWVMIRLTAYTSFLYRITSGARKIDLYPNPDPAPPSTDEGTSGWCEDDDDGDASQPFGPILISD